MRIRVLGSAAGGGFPQWNCDCPCCRAVRDGSRPAHPRTQSSVAVSGDGERWILLNASPDVQRQIEAFPALHPRPGRTPPVEAVLLTDAELDHTLGLLLLRESRGVRIYGTEPTKSMLNDGSGILRTLQAYCPVDWQTVTLGAEVSLPGELSVRAFDAPTKKPPRFDVPDGDGPGRVVGYRITDTSTGRVLVFLPCAQDLTPAVIGEIAGGSCLLIDGTCWSDDEMITLGLASKTSRDMGHVPISGEGGTLMRLATLHVYRKIYTHLNNTNPVLLEDSPERRAVESCGVEIAVDGMEIEF
jgi:pyrroloquinoline quinone biosynthesis protein B